MNSRLLEEIRGCARGAATVADDGSTVMEFVFPKNFLGFDGHFSGNPILPGIVQVMAAVLTAGGGSPMRLLKISRAKFSRIIVPGEALMVRSSAADKAGLIQAAVQITVLGETAASMTLTLDAAKDAA